MKSKIKHLFTACLCLIGIQVFAGIEPVNRRVQGADLYTLKGSAETFDLADNKYWMMADGFWSSEFTVQAVNNSITLGLDESDLTYFDASFAYRVRLNADLVQVIGDELVNSTINGIELTVDYDPARGTSYQDRSVYTFANAVSVAIEVVTIERLEGETWTEVVSSSLPESLFLETEIRTERYYPFDQTEIPSASTAVELTAGGDELKVVWPYVKGAEAYDLEWAWVNGYSGEKDGAGNSILLSAAEANYDFTLNATRVRINGKNTYTIPHIYGQGYILVRYRGVGKGGTDFSQPLIGRWSSDNAGLPGSNGAVSGYGGSGINYLAVSAHEGNEINYGAGMSFIEDGVRSVGVSYMDGVLKPRQSQAKLNGQDKIIVGSTIYDHYGRPAIGVMSTPVDENELGYIDNLNMHTDGTVYGKEHFDVDAATLGCATYVPAPPMSSTLSQGAANYYSEDNPDKEGYNAYLPDAEGYPFVQVQYANDPTGRIKRVGGLGPDHQIGNTTVDGATRDGHYTEFFYTTPDADEVYKLFGNEVVDPQNYTKVITKDVHGQLSMAIMDPMGRTITTYLAGEAPTGLDEIEGNDGLSPTSKNLMAYNTVNEEEGIRLVNHPLFVEEAGELYTFNYDFSAVSYTDCLPSTLCLDCIYDVVITIRPEEYDPNCHITNTSDENIDDAEGKVSFTYTVGSIEEFDPTDCAAPLTFSSENGAAAASFSVKFPKVGNYQVIKELRVSEEPADFYWEVYKDKSTCLLTEEDFFNEAITHLDPSDCDDMSPCEFNFLLENGTLDIYLAENPGETEVDYNVLKTAYLDNCGTLNPCEVLKPVMKADFSNGGQYCLGNFYATGPDAASSAWISVLGAPTTMAAVIADFGPFYEADGETVSTFDLDGDGTYESSITDLTLTQFGEQWRDSWAENFVRLHPEYCYYTFCSNHSALFDYEQDMNAVETYAEACSLGLVNPFAATYGISTPGCASTVDPIFGLLGTAPFDDAGLISEINAIVNETYDIGGGTVLSIYQYAAYFAGESSPYTFGTSGCAVDKHWEAFRSLYFSKRFQIIDLLKEAYVSSTSGCSAYAQCVGTTDAPCTGTPLATAIPRYFNYESAFFDLDVAIDPVVEGADAEAAIEAACLSQCEGLADTWMDQLAGCVPAGETWAAGNTTYDNVRAKLIEVCSGGCDPEWPFPSQIDPNNAPGNVIIKPDPADMMTWIFPSFQSVIESFIGAETVACSHLLVTNPLPTSFDNAGSLSKVLDDCGCEALLSTTDVDEFIAAYGFEPIDYDEEKCLCAGFDDGAGGASAGDGLITGGELTALDAATIATVNDYLCSSECVDCLTLQDPVDGFIPGFAGLFGGGVTYLTEPVLFTTYVNEQTGGSYTYEQLIALIENCDAVSGGSGIKVYHLLDDKAVEIRDVLNKLAEDGLTTSQTGLTYTTLPEYLLSSLYGCADAEAVTYDYTPTVGAADLAFNLNGCGTTCTFTLSVSGTLPAGMTAADVLANATAFGNVYMLTPINALDLKTLYMDATVSLPGGGTETVQIKVVNTCYDFITTHLTENQGKPSFRICTGQFVPEEEDCLDLLIEEIEIAAEERYEEYLAIQEALFKQNYIETCALVTDEAFSVDYQANHYHYTLLYYDQSGNLVKTVPPGGVAELTDVSGVLAHVADPVGSPAVYPNHSFETTYKHNSLNQVTEVTTPDGGTSRYFYDHLGRLVVSQNAKQADFNTGIITDDYSGGGTDIPAYSYTRYDALGRVVEVGEIIHPTAMTQALAKNPASLENWLNETVVMVVDVAYPVIRNNVTLMSYDRDYSAEAEAAFGGLGYGHTRNRITKTEVISGYIYPGGSGWDFSATNYVNHYQYDVHGNVKAYLQEIKALAEHDNRFRRVDYEYDLISGNPNFIYYQKGKPDQYIHQYIYDADNRLKEVFTSEKGAIWDRDVNYEYREDGSLARTEIGEMKVQGMDYAYTLHGWLKTLNSGVLNADYDMGRDGRRDGATEYAANENEIHALHAQDALAYTVGYYEHDYKAISDGITDFTNMQIANPAGSGFDLDQQDLFNGNITSLITNLTDFEGDKLNVHANTYHYDQLHRFKEMHVFQPNTDGSINSSNSLATATRKNLNAFSITTADGPSTTSLGDYEVHVDYDQNGNITKLIRNANYITGLNGGGSTISDNGMDEFSYIYDEPGTNKLTRVEDNNDNDVVTVGADPLKLGDIKEGQTGDVYTYHADGSLKSDVSEEIAHIDWYPSGKIKRIYRTSTSTQSDLYFEYDPMGMRTLKVEMTRTGTVINEAGLWKRTYYACDANGTPLAIYELDEDNQSNTLTKTETMLYGGARLGMDIAAVTVSGTATDLSCNADGKASFIFNVTGPSEAASWADEDVTIAFGGTTIASVEDWISPDFSVNELVTDINSAGLALEATLLSSGVDGANYVATIEVTETTPGAFALGTPVVYTTTGTRVAIRETRSFTTGDCYAERQLGLKYYELSNHLGNVMEVVTDRKITVDNATFDALTGDLVTVAPDGFTDYYVADVVQYSDYYPYGMTMPGRNGSIGSKYRYAFNGMEQDGAVSGSGNSYTTQFRQYDPRLGRWKSLDPLAAQFPWQSPFNGMDDNPIALTDPLGLSTGQGMDENGGGLTGSGTKEDPYRKTDGTGFKPGDWKNLDPDEATTIYAKDGNYLHKVEYKDGGWHVTETTRVPTESSDKSSNESTSSTGTEKELEVAVENPVRNVGDVWWANGDQHEMVTKNTIVRHPGGMVSTANGRTTPEYEFLAPQSYGHFGERGSDGLFYKGCASCHHVDGAYYYASHNSQENNLGMILGETVAILGPHIIDAAILRTTVQRNNFSTFIHEGKQGKHIVGHNNYQSGKSILLIDAQSLLDDFHVGDMVSMRVINETKVSVDFGKVIGIYVHKGNTYSTTVGTVVNSNTGAHIVPANPVQF